LKRGALREVSELSYLPQLIRLSIVMRAPILKDEIEETEMLRSEIQHLLIFSEL
jgi:hypothetical protein